MTSDHTQALEFDRQLDQLLSDPSAASSSTDSMLRVAGALQVHVSAITCPDTNPIRSVVLTAAAAAPTRSGRGLRGLMQRGRLVSVLVALVVLSTGAVAVAQTNTAVGRAVRAIGRTILPDRYESTSTRPSSPTPTAQQPASSPKETAVANPARPARKRTVRRTKRHAATAPTERPHESSNDSGSSGHAGGGSGSSGNGGGGSESGGESSSDDAGESHESEEQEQPEVESPEQPEDESPEPEDHANEQEQAED